MNSAVAIVGLACRFPGASGAGPYWRLLRDGVDAIGEIPRWDAERLHREGRIASRHGGFLEDVEHFDAAFFGITPKEAAAMDPQQRLVLELAWEALEDAGIVPAHLAKTDTGVFIGATTWDYNKIANTDVRFMTAHAGTGTVLCSLANRVSYVLDLRGPSMAVDTACSSSLTALHLACRSLRSGESTLALAGGVNLILSPESSIVLSQGGMLSPDGRCKAFDAAADGYGRSEGCGIVVLKLAADAARDGDRVLAYVRGTAVNQNGLSNGLSAPNGGAQQDVMRKALRDAGLPPKDIGYVEAHGTGTALGDPIEAAALRAVFMEGRTDEPCGIGSVKSNIGHTEAAAGIAGLIKVVLAMRHGLIPRSLHLSSLNPRVAAALADTPMSVATENVPWPSPRFGAVSSFGFGGANAHAVLEQSPACEAAPDEERSWLLALSARGSAALEQEASAMATFLRTTGEPLRDVAFTAATRRTHHPTRLGLVAQTKGEAADALAAFARGEEHPRIVRGPERVAKRKPKLVFVFSGQGSQWPGMARELTRTEPVFREAIERCHAAMRPYVEEELPVQPAIFAVQIALATLWASWGVTPDCVLGHSMGEIAAACVSGGLSLEDAARVICERSRLVMRSSGAMYSVELSRAAAEDAISAYGGRIAVAASNSPRSTILSGDEGPLRELKAALDARDVFARAIDVTFASHSAKMDPLRDELLQKLEGLEPRAPGVRFVSTVEGEAATFDAAYWWKNLRRPVLFWERVSELLDEGYETYLEVSPHPVLVPSIPAARTLPSLRRGQTESLLVSLGALHAAGYPVALDRVQSAHARVVSLPPYPWQKERHWLDVEPVASVPAPPSSEMLFETVWQREDAQAVPPGTWMVVEERRIAGGQAVTFEGEAPANILYLASRDSTLQDDVCGPLLQLVKAMVDAAWPAPPRLVIVTGDPSRHLACAALWGMGLTVAREHPEFRCTLIENHDDAPDPRMVGMVGEGDERVRVRDGQRFVARLTAAPAVREPFRVHPDGAYAITGAGGDLGRLVQKWLVDHGARHLVLLGRTPIVAAWPGVRVDSIAADVGDFEAVARALVPLPLRGVFHLAGSLDDGTLMNLTAERFSNHVFCGKALGAYNLHRATRAHSLDAFVLFSSAASTFGAPGAANYAAANAVLDALATHRRRQGLPATSIAWGPWMGKGLAVGKEREGRLTAQGMSGLTEGEGLALLERALGSGRPHLTAAKIGKAVRARGPLRRFLSLKKTATAFSSVDDLLCQEIAAITGLRTVPREETFHGMGLDSLAMLELRNTLEAELGVYLPIAALMAHPTVDDLSNFLRGRAATGGIIKRFSRGASPRLRLFCLTAAGTGASTFRDWPRALPPWVDVCAVQLPGREERAGERPHERWATLLDEIVTALSGELDVPFAFFGWSMGALIGYQAALQIHRATGVWPQRFFAAASTHPGGVGDLRRRHSKETWLEALTPHAGDEFRRILEADTALVYGATIEDHGPLGCPISAFAGDADPLIPSLAAWRSYTRDRFVHRVIGGGHRFPQTHASELLAWVRAELEETMHHE